MQFLSVINFAAAVQGIFLAYLLINRRAHAKEYRVLALLLVCMSLTVLGSVLGLSGYYRELPHLIRVADPLVFLFGSLLFAYMLLLTGRKLRPKFYLHLLPFLIYTLFTIPFYALTAEEKVRFGEALFIRNEKPGLVFAIQTLRSIHVGIYIFACLLLVRKFKAVLQINYSNIDKYNLDKARFLLRLFLVLLVVAMGIYLISLTGSINLIIANNLISLGTSIVIYGLAYATWNNPQSPTGSQMYVPASVEPEKKTDTPETKARTTYNISEEQYLKLSIQLKVLMEETKPYLDSEFSLTGLSDTLNLMPYLTSELISRYYRSSFFDVVNRLRVEEVKQRLNEPAYKHFSILAIAMDCGFNSKSSFNTAFKKFTGLTPSQFRQTEPA